MEIISVATDLSVPLHYFPHMSTMATKSLSPPSLEQLDNEVDQNSSSTTSYSCPILSSVSPDRLRALATTCVSSVGSATEVATVPRQQQQQQTPTTTATASATSSPSKLSTSTTVPAVLPGHKVGLPPLNLSSSPERQQSPHHSMVDRRDQSMTSSEVTESLGDSNAPFSRDSWMQFMRHMSNFYSKSKNQSASADTHSSVHNRLSHKEGSRSGQGDGCPTGPVNTNHSAAAAMVNDDNEAPPPGNSHQLDWFLRFQTMMNGMNQMATSQNQNLDTNAAHFDASPSSVGSNAPELFKYVFPFMATSSDQATKPATVRSPNQLPSEDQNLKTSNAHTNQPPAAPTNCIGVCPQLSQQNPVFSTDSGLLSSPSKNDFNPSSSTSLAFTASLLAMLTANHKTSSSSPLQPYHQLTTLSGSTDNHSNLSIPTALFPLPLSSMTKLTDTTFLSSNLTTSPGMQIGIGNAAPSYTTAVSDLPTPYQLAQLNASLFNLNPHKHGVPDNTGLPSSGLPQQVSDSRGLLYQIGQRLMAMATLSDFMNSASYPASLGPPPPPAPLTSDRVNTLSSLGQSIPSVAPPPHPTSFFNNSIEAAVAAAAAAAASTMVNQCGSTGSIFPGFPRSTSALGPKHVYSSTTSSVISPSLSSPSGMSSASSASPTLATPITGMSLVNENKAGVLEKGLAHQKAPPPLPPPHHHLMTSGAGPTNLSGISMRGNQKYSAYYQNQRKQGFSVAPTGTSGTFAGDYFYGNRAVGIMGGTSSSRRSGFPGSGPVLNSRHSNRRFRGHLSNSPSLSPHTVDSKAASQRISSGRATSVGLGGTPYPGYRNVGTGYKVSLSNASPVFSVHPSGTTTGSANAVSLAKSHGSTETGLPTCGQSGGATEAVGAIASRHKDTAFLCSCGKDFENLYVFIIHMKDTGHKPKSDNCDKDIPKLVRGQDMWINSETEQTREILRCMRCHQSFRSLPELTLHMMKTNHYSEIVYNDSGRLVFVNPDEHRRGSSNSSNTTPSLSTSGKVSPGLTVPAFPTRRGWKSLNYTATTSSSTGGTPSSLYANGSQTSLPDHCEDGRRPCDRPGVKGSSQSAIRTTESDDNHCSTERPAGLCNQPSQAVEKPSGETTPISGAVSPNTKDSSLYTNTPDCGSDRGSQKSPVSLKSDSCLSNHNTSGGGEINVLRQIESFVENNLPTGPKCLSVKTDGSASSASSSSFTYAPISALTPTSESGHNNWAGMPTKQPGPSLPSSKFDRKRRYSEANSGTNASHYTSPSASPVGEAKDAKIMAKESGNSGKAVHPPGSEGSSTDASSSILPSTTPSPSKVTSTTGDQHDIYEKQKLRAQQSKSPIENPLSSLQKLVDTTANKPMAPSAAFSELHTATYPQHISLAGTQTSGKPSPLGARPHSRTLGSQLQPSRLSVGALAESGNLRNTVGAPFASQPGTASSTEDPGMPALSALYAYVERSSPCQSQESATNLKESVSPEGSEPSKLFDRSEAILPRSFHSPLNHASVYTGEAQSSGPQSSPPSETASVANHPQQAAFCAAILSNLTGTQHVVNPSVPSTQGNTNAVLKDAPPQLAMPVDTPQFGREPMNTSGSGGNPQGSEMVNHWWRMLQYMLSCGGSPQFPMMPSALPENDNGQSRDAGKASTGSMKSEPRLSEANSTGRNPFIPSAGYSYPPSSMALGLNSIHSECSGGTSSVAPIVVPSSQFMTSLANYHGQAPPPSVAMSHRFNSNLMTQSGPGSGLTSGLVSSIITKKAKCHFCGKPFANKGQVRLHISKNKCPCLLQQSCHVAALADAFGGDSCRGGGMHNFANSGSHNSSLSGCSSMAANRFSPSSRGQKPLQSHLLPLGSTSAPAEDGLGVPSALSLLKERFQNFDLPLNSCHSHQQNQTQNQQTPNFSMITSPSPLKSHTAVSNASIPTTTGVTAPTSFSEASLSAIASYLPPNFLQLQNMLPTSSSSTANANHLAAMALLAQTLVQLTSSTATPEAVSSVSNEAAAAADRPAQERQPTTDDTSQPFASLEAFMPLLTASGRLDRKALFNSAQWFAHLAVNPSSRGSATTTTMAKHNTTTAAEADNKFRQSTSAGNSSACDPPDGQLTRTRPRSAATPNGHL